MKHPFQILQKQVEYYLCRATIDEGKTVRLTEKELASLRFNFNQLCYEVGFRQLEEVYQGLINDPTHKGGVFQERDLYNILIILETIRAAE